MGANDLGGTLMNESISRAAGASHGQELPPDAMEAMIRDTGRTPVQRTTLYQAAPEERRMAARNAAPLAEPITIRPTHGTLKRPRRNQTGVLAGAPENQ